MEKNEIGNRLKEFRENLGLTQKEIVEGLGIKAGSWSGYEKGLSAPSIPVLVELSNKYGLDLNWLLGVKSTSKKKIEDMTQFIDMFFCFPDFKFISIQNPEYLEATENFVEQTGEFYDPDNNFGNEIESLNKNVPAIWFEDPNIEEFLEKYQKTKAALDEHTIDNELFELWKEKQKNHYKGLELDNKND